MPAQVIVTDDASTEALKEAPARFNEKAKAERRRGYVGTRGERYKELHDAMEPLVDGILFRRALGLD